MTKEELIQFLKDNLIINISEKSNFSYSEYQSKRIDVELRLRVDDYHSEIISYDSFELQIV